MDALAILDKILSSKYPILALASIVIYYVIKGIKSNWPGFTKFLKESINRWLTDKEQQIEIQVELDIQIKSMVAATNTLQAQVKEMLGQNQEHKTLMAELSHKQDFIAEGFWENRKTLDAYFRKSDVIYKQIGILPEEKPQ